MEYKSKTVCFAWLKRDRHPWTSVKVVKPLLSHSLWILSFRIQGLAARATNLSVVFHSANRSASLLRSQQVLKPKLQSWCQNPFHVNIAEPQRGKKGCISQIFMAIRNLQDKPTYAMERLILAHSSLGFSLWFGWSAFGVCDDLQSMP